MTFIFIIIAMLAFVAAIIIMDDWSRTPKPATVKQVVGLIVALVVTVAGLYFGLCM